jgi:hypothetical protein
MKLRYVFVVAAIAACQPPAWYVAQVYSDNGMLYTERCAIDNGRYNDKPDPDHCRFEPVGPLPPAVRAKMPPPAPPTATTPAPPAQDALATPMQ